MKEKNLIAGQYNKRAPQSAAYIVLILGAILLGAPGCETSTETQLGYSFVGRVHDGATGARLTDYTISLIFWDQLLPGIVESDGRYRVGSLHEKHDFTIEITADGYRSFLSHNPMIEDIDDIRSYYYDAYLFPYDLPTPETLFYIYAGDTEERPSGLYRMRPVAASALYDDEAERPVGIQEGTEGVQRWENDEDLQFQTLFGSFSDGEFVLAPGELVYGVTYKVTLFGVNKYDETEGFFTAGVSGNQSYVLTANEGTPLMVSFESSSLGVPLDEAAVTVVFNQPIELDPLQGTNFYLNQLNLGFSIVSPDEDEDGEINALRATKRGVEMSLGIDRLTLRWNTADALELIDADDPITRVFFGGLDTLNLRPLGGDLDSVKSLASMLTSNTLTVRLNP
jgi:hypothetical protein